MVGTASKGEIWDILTTKSQRFLLVSRPVLAIKKFHRLIFSYQLLLTFRGKRNTTESSDHSSYLLTRLKWIVKNSFQRDGVRQR